MSQPHEQLVEYITPAEAVTALMPDAGSRFVARQILADALHSGDIFAAVDYVFEIKDIDPTESWDDMKSDAVQIHEDVEIPHEYWLMSMIWPDETRYWNWKTGNFLINMDSDPLMIFSGMMLENVQFNRSEVMALIGKTDRAGAGGPRSDREKWADFWVNFLYDCTQTEMDWSQFENRNQLKKAMQTSNEAWLSNRTEKGFSDSNIDFAVKIAWKGLVVRAAAEKQLRDGLPS